MTIATTASVNLPTTLLDKIKSSRTTLGDQLTLEAEIAGRLEASLKHDESLKIIRDSIPGEVMTFVPKWTPQTGMFVLVKEELHTAVYATLTSADIDLTVPLQIVGIGYNLDEVVFNLRTMSGGNLYIDYTAVVPWQLDAE
jgi:hypothetical protein